MNMDVEECVKEWEDLATDYKRLEVWLDDSQICSHFAPSYSLTAVILRIIGI